MTNKILTAALVAAAIVSTGAAKTRQVNPNLASVVSFNLVSAKATVTANKRSMSYTVEPGGDPNAIQLQFEDVDQVRIGKNGSIVLSMKNGDFRTYTATFYQTVDGKQKLVSGNFRILGTNRAAFHVGKHDTSLPLQIEAEIKGSEAGS